MGTMRAVKRDFNSCQCWRLSRADAIDIFECTLTKTSQGSLACSRINTRDQRLMVLRRTADLTNFLGTIRPKRDCSA